MAWLTARVPPWTFFPDFSAFNAYQSCLAVALGGCMAGTIGSALATAGPGAVFHQHWENAIYEGCDDPEAAVASYLADLDCFLACGGRLVWTLHNTVPHEDTQPELNVAVRRALVARATVVHVHGADAARVAHALGARPEQVLVAPHPGFHGAYPDDITDVQARGYFGLSPDETVFAHLGAMRAYKGMDTLQAAWAELRRGRSDARLILAGRGGPTHAARFVAQRPGVLLLPRHVEDSTIQYVMRAADFIVLPYARIMTSSGLMLALTFRRPVIVPSLPGLTEVVAEGREALVHPPGDVAGLAACLKAACGMDAGARRAMRDRARAAADRFTFDDMAEVLRAAAARGAMRAAA